MYKSRNAADWFASSAEASRGAAAKAVDKLAIMIIVETHAAAANSSCRHVPALDTDNVDLMHICGVVRSVLRRVEGILQAQRRGP